MFWTFHTFPCNFFSRELFLVAVHGWFAQYRQMYESSKHDWTLSGTATVIPPFFFLKILFLVPKVSKLWIFQKRCFMKIIWHRISIQTLFFQACLPTRQNGVENRDKAYLLRWFPEPWQSLLMEADWKHEMLWLQPRQRNYLSRRLVVISLHGTTPAPDDIFGGSYFHAEIGLLTENIAHSFSRHFDLTDLTHSNLLRSSSIWQKFVRSHGCFPRDME